MMNTVTKSVRNIRGGSADGASLRSPIGIHHDKLPTSFFHFVGELGEERTPRCIVDRTGQHTTRKAFDIQVFHGDKTVLGGQRPTEFVLKVRPLLLNVSM